MHASNKRTDSSKLRYFGIRFGNFGVSNYSAILLSIACAFVLRYFQNCCIETIFLARVPAEEFKVSYINVA